VEKTVKPDRANGFARSKNWPGTPSRLSRAVMVMMTAMMVVRRRERGRSKSRNCYQTEQHGKNL